MILNISFSFLSNPFILFFLMASFLLAYASAFSLLICWGFRSGDAFRSEKGGEHEGADDERKDQ